MLSPLSSTNTAPAIIDDNIVVLAASTKPSLSKAHSQLPYSNSEKRQAGRMPEPATLADDDYEDDDMEGD